MKANFGHVQFLTSLSDELMDERGSVNFEASESERIREIASVGFEKVLVSSSTVHGSKC